MIWRPYPEIVAEWMVQIFAMIFALPTPAFQRTKFGFRVIEKFRCVPYFAE